MGTIFYSMAGEGRGHASRAYTIIENLKKKHRIFLYTPEHAYDLLFPIYRNTDVIVKKIPGLLFHYNCRQEVDVFKSISESIRYLINSDLPLKLIYNDFEKYNPDLVITDFEWMLPKAAEKYKVPYISIDHQHFLSYYDLKSLPFDLRGKAAVVAPTLNFFYMNQTATIVSAFYFPKVKKNNRQDIYQTGVFINEDIRHSNPDDKKYILVYLRRFLTREVVASLENCGEKVIIYSNENVCDYGNISFKKVSRKNFAEDLSNCSMLVTTAGNQLVGEALYLRKPLIVMPEQNNFEQEINGFFLEQSCGGINISKENFHKETISDFYKKRHLFKCHTPRKKLCGNDKAISLIDNYILNAEIYRKEKIKISSF